MKVIISHDVDHLTVLEHLRDLIIPKFWIRSFIELSLGYISLKEFFVRFNEFLKNRWNHIEKLIEFDKEYNIPSTFFFGMNRGMGLSYSLELAEEYIQLVLNNGFDVGVHGIEFKNFEEMKREFETFKNLSQLESFGIRMHYLRMDNKTLEKLEKIGYVFDSSLYSIKNPFRIGEGNMWEFPLHIMDGYIILRGKKWQSLKLKEVIDITKRKIEDYCESGIEYLTILFHDRYFSESFRTWKEWYIQIVEYLKSNGFKFISYRQALEELSRR